MGNWTSEKQQHQKKGAGSGKAESGRNTKITEVAMEQSAHSFSSVTMEEQPSTSTTAIRTRSTSRSESMLSAQAVSHTEAQFPILNGRRLHHRCNWCYYFNPGENIRSSTYCEECRYAFCIPSKTCERNCWEKHVQSSTVLLK